MATEEDWDEFFNDMKEYVTSKFKEAPAPPAKDGPAPPTPPTDPPTDPPKKRKSWFGES